MTAKISATSHQEGSAMTPNATEPEPAPNEPSHQAPPAAVVVPVDPAREPCGAGGSDEPPEEPVGNDQFDWWGT
jgi:hypothetical protein